MHGQQNIKIRRTVFKYIMYVYLNSFVLSIGLFVYYLFTIHDFFMPGNETVVDIGGCYYTILHGAKSVLRS